MLDTHTLSRFDLKLKRDISERIKQIGTVKGEEEWDQEEDLDEGQDEDQGEHHENQDEGQDEGQDEDQEIEEAEFLQTEWESLVKILKED